MTSDLQGRYETYHRKGLDCGYFKDHWPSIIEEQILLTMTTPLLHLMRLLMLQYACHMRCWSSNNLIGSCYCWYPIVSLTSCLNQPHAVLIIQQFNRKLLLLVSHCLFDILPKSNDQIDACLGTYNLELGWTMALILLKPEDGTSHVMSLVRIPDRYQGFVEEIEKYNIDMTELTDIKPLQVYWQTRRWQPLLAV